MPAGSSRTRARRPRRELAERLAAEGVTLADGQVTEVCLALDGWLAGATRHLATGVVVLVDYADEPAALHDPARRPTGTLRAFAAHAVGADPFRHVGRQDLTATVDLAAVRAAAVRAGLEPLGETTQAELIATLGTGELTQAFLRREGAGLQDALDLRSALARLLDPRGMGAFRVLAFGRGLPRGTRLGRPRAARPARLADPRPSPDPIGIVRRAPLLEWPGRALAAMARPPHQALERGSAPSTTAGVRSTSRTS